MRSRRDFLMVLSAALGTLTLPTALVTAANSCRTQSEEADLIDKVLGKRESYSIQQTLRYTFGVDPATLPDGWTSTTWTYGNGSKAQWIRVSSVQSAPMAGGLR